MEIVRNKTRINSEWSNLFSAKAYHDWRVAGEFHQKIEKVLITPFLSRKKYNSILDLGTGTGLWANECKKINYSSRIIGVDVSSKLLQYGVEHSSEDICFQNIAAEDYNSSRDHDLIISAMSADYIGFRNVARCLRNNLASNGEALVWYLDPMHYKLQNNQRIKNWEIDGRNIQVSILNHTLSDNITILQNYDFNVAIYFSTFRLQDGKERRINILHITDLF